MHCYLVGVGGGGGGGIPNQLGIGTETVILPSVVAFQKEVPLATVVSFSSVVATVVVVGSTVSIEIFMNLQSTVILCKIISAHLVL